MTVDMRDFLARRSPVVESDRGGVGVDGSLDGWGQPPQLVHDLVGRFGEDLFDALSVRAGDNQRMARSEGFRVEEGDGALGFVDGRGGRLAVRNLTEDTLLHVPAFDSRP